MIQNVAQHSLFINILSSIKCELLIKQEFKYCSSYWEGSVIIHWLYLIIVLRAKNTQVLVLPKIPPSTNIFWDKNTHKFSHLIKIHISFHIDFKSHIFNVTFEPNVKTCVYFLSRKIFSIERSFVKNSCIFTF